jgi:hypothetical protein
MEFAMVKTLTQAKLRVAVTTMVYVALLLYSASAL